MGWVGCWSDGAETTTVCCVASCEELHILDRFPLRQTRFEHIM